MRDKIQLVQDMLTKSGSTKEASILMLDLFAEMAVRVEAVELENQRLRETIGAVATGKVAKPVTGSPGGFSIG